MADSPEFVSTLVKVKDSDLHILSDQDPGGSALEALLRYRLQIERYISKYPEFARSLIPLPKDQTAPPVVRNMLSAGLAAGVGPMAAVAGAIAEAVGRDLLATGSSEVMVENGGDIFLARKSPCQLAIFAGDSPLSMKIAIRIKDSAGGLGVCTSSASVGHSLSYGQADAVTVLSHSTALADAVATRLGNEVARGLKAENAIRHALEIGRSLEGVLGIVIICKDRMGAVGDVELTRIEEGCKDGGNNRDTGYGTKDTG